MSRRSHTETPEVQGDSDPVVIVGKKDLLLASQEEFQAGDDIGVYFEPTASSEPIAEDENVRYNARQNGLFYPAEGVGIVPKERGGKLFAYYPYRKDITGAVLPIDLSDQRDVSRIDLLWAESDFTPHNGSNLVGMTFSHMLGLVEFAFLPKDNRHPLPRQISITIYGLLTEASMDLKTGEITKGKKRQKVTVIADSKKRAYLLLLPGEKITKVTFRLDGIDKEYTLPTSYEAKAGKRISLTFRPYSDQVVELSSYMEVPLSTVDYPDAVEVKHTAPDQWFGGGTSPSGERRNYTILFDKKKRQPLWVAYPLYRDCIGGSGRKGKWAFDTSVDVAFQQDVCSRSYRPANEYDRGHMLASAMRTASVNLNQSTFLMTNIVPQKAEQNQGCWQEMEEAERRWAKGTDTLFVVCGPIFSEVAQHYTEDNRGNKIVVPDYTYKVLLKKNNKGEWTSLGVKIPNTLEAGRDKWYRYQVTVKSLEKELGFTFFSQLPREVSDQVKSQIGRKGWE